MPIQAEAQENQNNSPVKFAVTNTFDVMTNVKGGSRRETAVLYNLDVTAEFDAAHIGLDGGSLFIYGLVNNSKQLNPIVGDFQASSNIDNSELFRLYEFWYEQMFDDGRGSVKLGLFDLNSEFDVNEPGGLFLNSSHGIGPDLAQTGENGPSIFPSTSLAARVQYQLNNKLLLRAVILDAILNDPDNPKSHKFHLDDGVLLLGEAEITLTEGWQGVFGVWHYSGKFPSIDENITEKLSGNTGFYSLIAGALNDKTSVWFRIGKANEDINQLSHYIGGGIVYTGPLTSRPEDEIGFAIAAAGNGSPYKNMFAQQLNPVDNYEIAYELTYRFAVTPWLVVQPDIQYIQNPSMNPSLKDALVIGARIEIGTEF